MTLPDGIFSIHLVAVACTTATASFVTVGAEITVAAGSVTAVLAIASSIAAISEDVLTACHSWCCCFICCCSCDDITGRIGDLSSSFVCKGQKTGLSH